MAYRRGDTTLVAESYICSIWHVFKNMMREAPEAGFAGRTVAIPEITRMKYSIHLFFIIVLAFTSRPANSYAQQKAAGAEVKAMHRFPGFTAAQMSVLLQAKSRYPIPLPTWLPAGFKVDKIIAKVDKQVRIEDQVLEIYYIKQLPNGKHQRFVMRAGIDGIGDMVYTPTDEIKTVFGEVQLGYEPKDFDGPVKNWVATDWFDVGHTAWSYGSNFIVDDGKDKRLVMIPKSDTKKIIASLRRL